MSLSNSGKFSNITSFSNVTSGTCRSSGYSTTDRAVAFVENSFELAIVILVVNVLLPIFAIIGNTLVVFAVLVFEQLRVPANYLLVNLALSDLVLGSFIQIRYTIHLARAVTGQEPYCPEYFIYTASLIIGTVSILASVSTLCLITSDRFIAIVFSMRYSNIVTSSRLKIAIVLSWLLSIGLSIGYQIPNNLQSIFRLFFLLYILGACVVMVSLHLKLFLISRRHYREICSETLRFNPEAKQEKKAVKTVLILGLALLLTYIPRVLLRIEESVFGDGEEGSVERTTHDALDYISATMMLLSSTINPYVFFLRSERLRQYVWRLIHSTIDCVKG